MIAIIDTSLGEAPFGAVIFTAKALKTNAKATSTKPNSK
jgi:hypothetical protein